MAKKTPHTVEEIVDFLKKENENSTIEGNLLRKKLIRELYKQIGDPREKDFPDVFKHASYWKKFPGYTTDISFMTEEQMKNRNREHTRWHIQRASYTKCMIESEYRDDGWHCEVQSYNVICTKYVKHPKHKNIWVMFYSSRDCARFRYVIKEDE